MLNCCGVLWRGVGGNRSFTSALSGLRLAAAPTRAQVKIEVEVEVR